MSKENFIQFYNVFTSLIKQEVSGDYCMNASCLMIDYCGGYCLVLRPNCLLWGSELVLMEALAHRFLVTMNVVIYDGVIEFY